MHISSNFHFVVMGNDYIALCPSLFLCFSFSHNDSMLIFISGNETQNSILSVVLPQYFFQHTHMAGNNNFTKNEPRPVSDMQLFACYWIRLFVHAGVYQNVMT